MDSTTLLKAIDLGVTALLLLIGSWAARAYLPRLDKLNENLQAMAQALTISNERETTQTAAIGAIVPAVQAEVRPVRESQQRVEQDIAGIFALARQPRPSAQALRSAATGDPR